MPEPKSLYDMSHAELITKVYDLSEDYRMLWDREKLLVEKMEAIADLVTKYTTSAIDQDPFVDAIVEIGAWWVDYNVEMGERT